MCLKRGKIFGFCLGDGQIKGPLPDAHTDFIFSVAAEEIRRYFCCMLGFIYLLIVFRSFSLA